MDKIVVEHLSVTYSDRTESLRDISLTIREKAITALIGPAGGGKSTFLRVLNRLTDLADVVNVSGKVLVGGVDVLDPKLDAPALRKSVGIVFSRPTPLPMSIYRNVSYGLEIAGERDLQRMNARVEKALRQAELWDEVYDRLHDSAYAISGGQQQRLCMARSLALEPDILLLDEPTSALDPISTARIESSLERMKDEITVVIAPHSTQQASRIADHVAFFLQGELIEYAPRDEIFLNPRDRRTQDYIQGRFG